MAMATAPDDKPNVIKEGYMKTEKRSHWPLKYNSTPAWCVLEQDRTLAFSTYKDKTKSKLNESIRFQEVNKLEVDKQQDDTYLCIKYGKQILHLRAKTKQHRDEWYGAIMQSLGRLQGAAAGDQAGIGYDGESMRGRIGSESTANRPPSTTRGRRPSLGIVQTSPGVYNTFQDELKRVVSSAPRPAVQEKRNDGSAYHDDDVSKVHSRCCIRKHEVIQEDKAFNEYSNVHYVTPEEELGYNTNCRWKKLERTKDIYTDFHNVKELQGDDDSEHLEKGVSEVQISSAAMTTTIQNNLGPDSPKDDRFKYWPNIVEEEATSSSCFSIEDNSEVKDDNYDSEEQKPDRSPPSGNKDYSRFCLRKHEQDKGINKRSDDRCVPSEEEVRSETTCRSGRKPKRAKERHSDRRSGMKLSEVVIYEVYLPAGATTTQNNLGPDFRNDHVKYRANAEEQSTSSSSSSNEDNLEPEVKLCRDPQREQKASRPAPLPIVPFCTGERLMSKIQQLKEDQKRLSITRTFDKSSLIGNKIILMEVNGGVWVIGWDHRETQLTGSIKVGDELIQINSQTLKSVAFAMDIVKSTDGHKVQLRLTRIPLGFVCTIKRTSPEDDLGIQLEGIEIISVNPQGLASKQGDLRHQTTGITGRRCNWAITEINAQAVDLFASSDKVIELLRQAKEDVVLIVQPVDFIKSMKESLKGTRHKQSVGSSVVVEATTSEAEATTFKAEATRPRPKPKPPRPRPRPQPRPAKQ